MQSRGACALVTTAPKPRVLIARPIRCPTCDEPLRASGNYPCAAGPPMLFRRWLTIGAPLLRRHRVTPEPVV